MNEQDAIDRLLRDLKKLCQKHDVKITGSIFRPTYIFDSIFAGPDGVSASVALCTARAKDDEE